MMSRAIRAENSSGVLVNTSVACDTSMWVTASLCAALTNSAWSLFTIGAGMAAGPTMPNQVCMWSPESRAPSWWRHPERSQSGLRW
jgi:predicted phage tail protein